MKRIKNLDGYQKGILIFMIVMIAAFAVLYFITISKVGFEYGNTILIESSENGNTIYSGKIDGYQASFTVSGEKTVVFQYGEKVYGPYTVKEDSAAIPKDKKTAENMHGVELFKGDTVIFRGGVQEAKGGYRLYNEDGTPDMGEIYVAGETETDFMEPDVSTILNLMNNPKLTHKGEWKIWIVAVFFCILNVILILFEEELFRWDIKFRIRNADNAEPSGLEITGRYIGWTIITIVALGIFIIGLL